MTSGRRLQCLVRRGLLREHVPETKVIVLTTYADDRSVIDALQAGAHGYLTKDAGGAEIRHALKQVLDNHAVIDPAVQHHVVDAIATLSSAQARRSLSPLPAGLTPREAEVVSLIATGMSNSEITEHLVVSEGTVKSRGHPWRCPVMNGYALRRPCEPRDR